MLRQTLKGVGDQLPWLKCLWEKECFHWFLASAFSSWSWTVEGSNLQMALVFADRTLLDGVRPGRVGPWSCMVINRPFWLFSSSLFQSNKTNTYEVKCVLPQFFEEAYAKRRQTCCLALLANICTPVFSPLLLLAHYLLGWFWTIFGVDRGHFRTT